MNHNPYYHQMMAATNQVQSEDGKYNVHAPDYNYWQWAPYDFDKGDRTTILPHDTFGKYYYPDYFTNPGQDWEACAP